MIWYTDMKMFFLICEVKCPPHLLFASFDSADWKT